MHPSGVQANSQYCSVVRYSARSVKRIMHLWCRERLTFSFKQMATGGASQTTGVPMQFPSTQPSETVQRLSSSQIASLLAVRYFLPSNKRLGPPLATIWQIYRRSDVDAYLLGKDSFHNYNRKGSSHVVVLDAFRRCESPRFLRFCWLCWICMQGAGG